MIVGKVATNLHTASNPWTEVERREIVGCLLTCDAVGKQLHLERFFESVEGEFRSALGQHGDAFPFLQASAP